MLIAIFKPKPPFSPEAALIVRAFSAESGPAIRAKDNQIGSFRRKPEGTDPDRQRLFPLESAAGFDKGVDGEVKADQRENSLNRCPLVVGKVVFMVLAHQGGCPQNGEKNEDQAGGLEPEGIKRAADGNNKRFSAGKDR
ncbi:MAG TPA: hypothetical protein VHV32_06290, partial [Candidatus Angelobacter sp.]|nr:hypothetical protein [Candidatus Angelobacter sp.]